MFYFFLLFCFILFTQSHCVKPPWRHRRLSIHSAWKNINRIIGFHVDFCRIHSDRAENREIKFSFKHPTKQWSIWFIHWAILFYPAMWQMMDDRQDSWKEKIERDCIEHRDIFREGGKILFHSLQPAREKTTTLVVSNSFNGLMMNEFEPYCW